MHNIVTGSEIRGERDKRSTGQLCLDSLKIAPAYASDLSDGHKTRRTCELHKNAPVSHRLSLYFKRFVLTIDPPAPHAAPGGRPERAMVVGGGGVSRGNPRALFDHNYTSN